jgi:hypothetical protein
LKWRDPKRQNPWDIAIKADDKIDLAWGEPPFPIRNLGNSSDSSIPPIACDEIVNDSYYVPPWIAEARPPLEKAK